MNSALLSPFMKRRVALIVGVIGLLAFGGFMWIAFVGSGLISFGGQKVEAVFTDGLNLVPRSSEVRLNGLKVGKVVSIELRGDDVVATVQLDGDIDLRADASAKLMLVNLLGEKFMDLDPGTSSEALDGPITDTWIAADFTQLSAGGPDSLALYKDLARDPVMRSLSTAAGEAPSLSSEVETQLDELRVTTEQLVQGQSQMLGTIDDLAALTSALVGSSDALGRLLDSSKIIQRQTEVLRDIATVQFARADTAVKVVEAVLSARRPDIEALTARLRVVYREGVEAFELFEDGASIPVAIFGLGPLGDTDTRHEGPNPWPPVILYPVPTEEELEGG